MDYSTLLLGIENNTCIITINRPDKMNALTNQVLVDLNQALDEVISNADIKSVIITGAGPKAFVAGADISEFISLSKEDAVNLAKQGQGVFKKIEDCPKPVIAVVNGFALGGGCELAMACHFRICTENARFGQPEVNLGLIAGYGGTQRLTHLIGKGKSMELHMTGNMIDAAEALNLRLVNYVLPSDQAMDKAKEILQLIHTKAPFAVSKVIEAVNAAETSEGLKGFEKEVELFGTCFETNDVREGTSAFLEKRKPSFTGK